MFSKSFIQILPYQIECPPISKEGPKVGLCRADGTLRDSLETAMNLPLNSRGELKLKLTENLAKFWKTLGLHTLP